MRNLQKLTCTVYHAEPKEKIIEKWTENKPMSMIIPIQSDYRERSYEALRIDRQYL